MLTGTPLDLTPFGPLLSGAGGAYIALALSLVCIALWLPKTRIAKAGLALAFLTAFSYPLVRRAEPVKPVLNAAPAAHSASQLTAAMTLFAERCKNAGEKIVRTIENVDGVVWLKWREKYSNADNFADQFKLNDPFGRDCGAEDCVANLLRVTAGSGLRPEEARRHSLGFRWVETVDPADGLRYRYRSVIRSVHTRTPQELQEYKKNEGRDPGPDVFGRTLQRERIAEFRSRHGILWEDISTREDREHWIAASSLKVIDLVTNEVLGERIGYMIDPGQGSQAGFRSPWLEAVQKACPAFPSNAPSDLRPRRNYMTTETLAFSIRVLKPSSGD
jgi:hypothetical protein